jgi:hypothetical protein
VRAGDVERCADGRLEASLFAEQYYTTVFDGTTAAYYLNRFWLLRRVGLASSSYPERAYAGWVVLHFMWAKIGREISSRSDGFCAACEQPRQNEAFLKPRSAESQTVQRSGLRSLRRRGPATGTPKQKRSRASTVSKLAARTSRRSKRPKSRRWIVAFPEHRRGGATFAAGRRVTFTPMREILRRLGD